MIVDNTSFARRFDTAIILHLYYEDLTDEIFSTYLDALVDRVDLFVTVQPGVAAVTIENIRRRFPNSYFLVAENRGRDIRPFIQTLPLLQQFGYAYFCKIHTKKTLHETGGDAWRKRLLDGLLENPAKVEQLINGLRNSPTLGLMTPASNFLPCNDAKLPRIREWLDRLMLKLGLQTGDHQYEFLFPAGSMYWGRVTAFEKLFDGTLCTPDDFEQEAGQIDGTLAHAIERFIGFLIPQQGYIVGAIAPPKPVKEMM